MRDAGFTSADRLWTCGTHKAFPREASRGSNAPAWDLLQRSMARILLLRTRGDCGHPVHHFHEMTMSVLHHASSLCFVSFQSFIQSLIRIRFTRLSSGTAQEANWLDLIFWDIMGLLWACNEGGIVRNSIVILLYFDMKIRTISGIFFCSETAWSFSHGTWDFYAIGIFISAIVPKLPSQSMDKSWLFEGMTHQTYFKCLLSDERHCSLELPISIYSYKNFEGYSNVDLGTWTVEFHSGKHIGQLLLALLMRMVACT